MQDEILGKQIMTNKHLLIRFVEIKIFPAEKCGASIKKIKKRGEVAVGALKINFKGFTRSLRWKTPSGNEYAGFLDHQFLTSFTA